MANADFYVDVRLRTRVNDVASGAAAKAYVASLKVGEQVQKAATRNNPANDPNNGVVLDDVTFELLPLSANKVGV